MRGLVSVGRGMTVVADELCWLPAVELRYDICRAAYYIPHLRSRIQEDVLFDRY